MLTQLFKIMWHRKGKNTLLLAEIFFSFLVLFLTGTFIVEGVLNYYTPAGFDYADVYDLEMRVHTDSNQDRIAKLQQIKQLLQSTPEINSFSLTNSNTPFSFNILTDNVEVNGQAEQTNLYLADPAYFETMDMVLLEGKWFGKEDLGNTKPVVINEKLRDEIFPDQNAVGQKIRFQGQERDYKVVGIVKHFRQDGEISAPENAIFQMYAEGDTAEIPSNILLEIKAGVADGWQQPLLDKVSNIAGDWMVDLTPQTTMRSNKLQTKFIPVIALSVVCAFLVFNVALGLFGVLYQNINKRYAEIGIRRAMGATAAKVHWQMLAEVLVLATFGLLLGLLLAVQFPLLGVMNVAPGVYIISMLCSLFLIYLLVSLCAWYPSKQASRIEPADALHYE